ncbi:hypothetical protein [Micromonospora ureilytica]|uniref:Uncharacterized protein n=1 Tax=Micromonospora ureilytica TaxID=709868 RepID=A0ABS0JMF1_9ACTN|nr:hypothetical protein [Micromonospora ureilytica]MBG6067852.1 hypothetical protein [Micromonospora ureilytica]
MNNPTDVLTGVTVAQAEAIARRGAQDLYAARASLRFDVSRAITCRCGTLLDAPRAVAVEMNGRSMGVVCLPCWSGGIRRSVVATGADITVIDGRDLWPAR